MPSDARLREVIANPEDEQQLRLAEAYLAKVPPTWATDAVEYAHMNLIDIAGELNVPWGFLLKAIAEAVDNRRHEVRQPDKYIVELEPGVWLVAEGDPPATTRNKEIAQSWNNVESAAGGLVAANTYREFPDAKIVTIPQSIQNAKRTCEEFDAANTPSGIALRGDRLAPGHLAIIQGDCPSLSLICVIIEHSEKGMIAAKYISTKRHKKTIYELAVMWTPLADFGKQAWLEDREVFLADTGTPRRKWQQRNGDPDRIRGKRKMLRLAKEAAQPDMPF